MIKKFQPTVPLTPEEKQELQQEAREATKLFRKLIEKDRNKLLEKK